MWVLTKTFQTTLTKNLAGEEPPKAYPSTKKRTREERDEDNDGTGDEEQDVMQVDIAIPPSACESRLAFVRDSFLTLRYSTKCRNNATQDVFSS